VSKLDLKDKPGRLWNYNETGLTYVLRPGKVVSQVGKKSLFTNRASEKEE
jgi:hypothetical protein